jgi:hypothetical protein
VTRYLSVADVLVLAIADGSLREVGEIAEALAPMVRLPD